MNNWLIKRRIKQQTFEKQHQFMQEQIYLNDINITLHKLDTRDIFIDTSIILISGTIVSKFMNINNNVFNSIVVLIFMLTIILMLLSSIQTRKFNNNRYKEYKNDYNINKEPTEDHLPDGIKLDNLSKICFFIGIILINNNNIFNVLKYITC